MFVIRRKSDGKFLSRGYNWKLPETERRWTDRLPKARVFGRMSDAKQSIGWVKEGTYTAPKPGPYKTWEQYSKEHRDYEASFVPVAEEKRSVELVKVFMIPETLLKG